MITGKDILEGFMGYEGGSQTPEQVKKGWDELDEFQRALFEYAASHLNDRFIVPLRGEEFLQKLKEEK